MKRIDSERRSLNAVVNYELQWGEIVSRPRHGAAA